MVDDSAPRIPELQALVSRVATDANVQGLILTGSWARGMATEHSDVDVYVVLQHQQGWVTTRTKEIDLPALTLDQLQAVPRDPRQWWDRYSFVDARVLLDRTGGLLTPLIDAWANLSRDEV
jgi:predicted nucleotidyltransferase